MQKTEIFENIINTAESYQNWMIIFADAAWNADPEIGDVEEEIWVVRAKIEHNVQQFCENLNNNCETTIQEAQQAINTLLSIGTTFTTEQANIIRQAIQ